MDVQRKTTCRQRKTNTVGFHLYVESKKENKLIVNQRGEGEIGKGS